jgi:hypothetical protein
VVADTHAFKQACSALTQLFRFFEQHFGEGKVKPWSMSNMGDMEAITAETRYVSPLSDLPIWGDASPQLKECPIYDRDGVIQN